MGSEIHRHIINQQLKDCGDRSRAGCLRADGYRLVGVFEECFYSGVDGGELISDALYSGERLGYDG